MIYRFGDFQLDDELFELSKNGEPVRVEHRVLDLVVYLIQHRERVVPREELARLLWPDVVVDHRHGLDQAVYTARRALGDSGAAGRLIETKRGRGFRFSGEVETYIAPPQKRPDTMPFVGRDLDTVRFCSALDALEESCGVIALISGEAGIGKSRLLSWFSKLAREREISVCLAACPAETAAPDYWPWVQVLRALREERGGLNVPDDPSLLPVSRWLSDDFPVSESASAEPSPRMLFRLFDWVHAVLADAAIERPLALLIDDVHLADRPSLRLLKYLAAQLSQSPVALICSVRNPLQGARGHRNPGALADALADLDRAPHLVRMDLQGLSAEEIRQLLRPYVEVSALDPASHGLAEKTAGNPFFLHQLIPYVNRSTGRLTERLPATVGGAVTARIASLPPLTSRVLAEVSVLIADFAPTLAASVCDLTLEELSEALSPACVEGVVLQAPDGRLGFSHSIIRDVLYAELALEDKCRLHQAAAEWHEGRETSTEDDIRAAAFHRMRTLPLGPRDAALSAVSRAALLSQALGAFDEASIHYEKCAALANVSRDQQAFRIRHGEMLVRAGQRVEGRAAIQRALQRPAPFVDLGEVALRIAPGFFAIEAGAQDQFLEDLLRSSLENSHCRPAVNTALLKARLAMAVYWNPADDGERARLAEQAREIIDGNGESSAEKSWARTYLMAAEWSPDTLGARLQANFETARCRETSPECRLVNYVFLITSLIEKGDLESACGEIRRFSQMVENGSVKQAEWYPTLFRGLVAVERGRLDEALSLAQRMAVQGARAGDANATQSFGALHAMCSFHREPDLDLAKSLETMVERFPAIHAWETALALTLYRAGAGSAAREIYDRRLGGLSLARRDLMWLVSVVHLADLCADLDDPAGAAPLLAQLLPMSGRRVPVGYGVVTWGSVDRAIARLLGCLGRMGDAEESFRRAIESDRACRSWVWLAYSYTDYAETLWRGGSDGRRERLRIAAQRALRLAARSGQSYLQQRAANVAQRIGGRGIAREVQ